MCKFKSAIVKKDGTLLHLDGVDSHEEIIEYYKLKDDKIESDFCRVEFSPKKEEDIVYPEKYIFKIDQGVPAWFTKVKQNKAKKELRSIVEEYIIDNDLIMLPVGFYILKGDITVLYAGSSKIYEELRSTIFSEKKLIIYYASSSTIYDAGDSIIFFAGGSKIYNAKNSKILDAGCSTIYDAKNSKIYNAKNSKIYDAASSTIYDAKNSTIVDAKNSKIYSAGSSTIYNAGDSIIVDAGNSKIHKKFTNILRRLFNNI